MFQHILVPTDGSPLSSSTVLHAIRFASEISARITFFYAKPDYPIAFFGEGALIDPSTPEKYSAVAEQQAQDILQNCCELARRENVECGFCSKTSDTPFEAIIAVAEENNCDLIFMSSHGRRGLGALILGSETQKVLTHTHIPVLVYR